VRKKNKYHMDNMMKQCSIKYIDIDFDTQRKIEALKVLDRLTGMIYSFTKEFLLDQLIIPRVQKMKGEYVKFYGQPTTALLRKDMTEKGWREALKTYPKILTTPKKMLEGL
jgi:hypothetical protein